LLSYFMEKGRLASILEMCPERVSSLHSNLMFINLLCKIPREGLQASIHPGGAKTGPS
jgi:hypothetical protein